MISEFRGLFGGGETPRVFRAPGRVNLIGEHTDYNLGFVMPMALQLATYIAAAPSGEGKVRIHSEQHRDTREWKLEEFLRQQRSGHWTDYPVGVAHELAKLGVEIRPLNLLVRSTVPEGSGLSSSAAIEVSSALAFLSGRELAPLEIARLCQRAEREFVGIPCGIMDQYVSVFGREHAAVEIDCRSLQHRYATLPANAAFVAVNSMVKHALAGSAYGDRVRECTQAATALGVASLRDVAPERLERDAHLLSPLVLKRARHVVTENARVNRFVEASNRADLPTMGRLMVESHRSLQHDYEVSSAELDFLVDSALQIDGVFGSRMTGGGFGGCTVTMLRPDAEEAFTREIAAVYQRRFNVVPAVYRCVPSAGAGEVADLRSIPSAAA
jgi:galactokinase